MAGKQADSSAGSRAPARPVDPVDLLESVAGEEDPGASFDLPVEGAGRAGLPAGATVCPKCGGSGRLGASACSECGGTGKVAVGMGGA